MKRELIGRPVQAVVELESATPPHEKKVVDEAESGFLLGFGTMWEELLNGVGQYTTAIVEYPDGRIREYPVESVRFI